MKTMNAAFLMMTGFCVAGHRPDSVAIVLPPDSSTERQPTTMLPAREWAAPPVQLVKDERHTISTQSVSASDPQDACRIGEACRVRVIVTAMPGYRVNEEYPTRLVLEPAPGMDLERTKFSKEAGDFVLESATQAVITATLTLKQPRIVLKATVKFCIDSGTACYPSPAPLEIPVVAATGRGTLVPVVVTCEPGTNPAAMQPWVTIVPASFRLPAESCSKMELMGKLIYERQSDFAARKCDRAGVEFQIPPGEHWLLSIQAGTGIRQMGVQRKIVVSEPRQIDLREADVVDDFSCGD